MGMPVGSYLELVSALPEAEFVDAADIIVSLRMVKAPEEMAYLRRAAEITGRARQRVFDEVRPGMTERELVRLVRRLILEEGGDRTSFVHLQLDLAGSKNAFPYDRPLQAGTVLAVDTGAYVGMYTVDYARMAVLGKATDEQRRVHAAALQVNQQMMDALRPGVRCSELYAVAIGAIKEAGVTVDLTGRSGLAVPEWDTARACC